MKGWIQFSITIHFSQDKTRKLLSSKAELVTAQQTAVIAKKTAEELEFSCNNLDEVS